MSSRHPTHNRPRGPAHHHSHPSLILDIDAARVWTIVTTTNSPHAGRLGTVVTYTYSPHYHRLIRDVDPPAWP